MPAPSLTACHFEWPYGVVWRSEGESEEHQTNVRRGQREAQCGGKTRAVTTVIAVTAVIPRSELNGLSIPPTPFDPLFVFIVFIVFHFLFIKDA